MDQEENSNGYVVQFYQYARRYRYNNEGCLKFFNELLDRREALGIEKYTLESDFLVFGEFDLLQVINVETFREYHDVPELAKDWLGKRQSVLLYDISQAGMPTRVCYDERNRLWKRRSINGDNEEIKARFLCFSLVSLTNEIVERTGNISELLKLLRLKILSVIDEVNRSKAGELECEVFGTFNPSEIGIVWLSDQYADVLQVMDFLKHMKVREDSGIESGDVAEYQAFLTSFSTIAIKERTDFSGVRGKALIQIAMHDIIKDYGQIVDFANEIIGEGSGNILGSVGEYDLVLEATAERAVELIQNKGLLCVGEREEGTGKFKIVNPKFLYSNTKLLYDEADTREIKEKLNELHKKGYFYIVWPKGLKDFSRWFEWEELKYSGYNTQDGKGEMSNADYFQTVRQKLKGSISSSAGAVDTLDLLYADYQSTISSAYSAMWVSDLHRQFKAVLHAINLLLTSGDLTWSWNDYRDLTNAFKQQIYHLAQSSKMFLEIPSCHLRATGQYDFLMHAYFGVTKRILEVIYLSQGEDAQSELVPLITVNTVPQVRTQLYFELGEDDRRVVNLDIPNSIIFDFQRGIWYLTHEMFHYAVPQKREMRNYYMAVFLLSLISKKQIFWILRELLSARVDGLICETTKKEVGRILKGETAEGEEAEENIAKIYRIVNRYVRKYILIHFDKVEEYVIKRSKRDDLSNNYQRAIYEFVESDEWDGLFRELFMEIYPPVFAILLKEDDLGDEQNMRWIRDRIKYCQRKDGYIKEFIETSAIRRKFNLELKTNIRVIREHIWAAVREACSDIAMVSLNGLDIVDYMLFCIQAWTDENNNKKQILSQMNQESEKKEWIRYSLVAEYIREHSDGEDYASDRKKAEKEFCRRYVWFYAGKRAKKPNKNRDREATVRFCDKYKEAKEWLCFLADCRNRVYYEEFSWYYEEILEKLLSDFDIENRIKILEKQNIDGNKEYICRLKDIRREFKEKVYLPYSEIYAYIPDKFEDFFQGIGIDDINECDSRYNAARFKQDISVANHFQNQTSLRELGVLNFKIRKKNKKHIILPVKPEISVPDTAVLPKIDTSCWKFYARSLTELLFYIQFCFDKLVETAKEDGYVIGQRQNPKIWFRGHSSVEYTHIPTAMRNFKDDKMRHYYSLRDYQQSNFEEFKFRADGALEMSSGQQFTRSDYIAMMQHYVAPTNFLDWTENAYTSLYLALKYHYRHDLKKTDSEYRNVTLSIFNPGIYNHVRQDSMDHIRDNLEELYKKAEPRLQKILEDLGKVIRPENKYANLVPNLSMKENEERYNMFLLGDAETERYLVELKNQPENFTDVEKEFFRQYSQVYQTDMKALFMPMAVLTSRLNPRIRTQCGCFVAYNLYAPPEPESDKNAGKSLFEYISLEEIQKEKKEEAVFMYQIEIDKECCADVVKWLRTLGVSREYIYPELSEKGYHFN